MREMWFIDCSYMYTFVPGKCPWALAAQAPKLKMGGCMEEVTHEVYQNDRSHLRKLSRLTFGALHKNLARWVVTRRTSKKPQYGTKNHNALPYCLVRHWQYRCHLEWL